MCLQISNHNHSSRDVIMSLKQPSRKLEVTMVVSLKILELMSYIKNLELLWFLAKSTPQSNGFIERKNRTLIDMARSMLISEYNVSHSFWAKAINMACYCSNRLYCHPIMEKTPYKLLNGRKPNIAYFRVFRCKCYILKKDTRLSKFKKKCDEGFLLGYSTTSKAYRV
jgi:hypothetical protein